MARSEPAATAFSIGVLRIQSRRHHHKPVLLRQGRCKYIYHVRMRPMLFDLETDPGEMRET